MWLFWRSPNDVTVAVEKFNILAVLGDCLQSGPWACDCPEDLLMASLSQLKNDDFPSILGLGGYPQIPENQPWTPKVEMLEPLGAALAQNLDF